MMMVNRLTGQRPSYPYPYPNSYPYPYPNSDFHSFLLLKDQTNHYQDHMMVNRPTGHRPSCGKKIK